MPPDPNDFETFFAPGGDPESSPKPVTPPAGGGETQSVGDTYSEMLKNKEATASPKPDAVPPKSPPPTPPSPRTDNLSRQDLSQTGEFLVRLDIVSQSQWDDAVRESGADADLAVVLEKLREYPSARRSRVDSHLTALTSFQVNEILAGNASKLRLGQYLLFDRLGAGGMGEVYKGWNLSLDRIEAIKVITRDEVTGSTIGMARFENEARILGQLHHPCITTVFSYGREQGVAYIAMEYVRGKTLLEIVNEAKSNGENVPVDWAVDVIREVAGALDHAHSLDFVHRDIKPNNIMMTNEGEVRLLDMGIAKILNPDASKSGTNLTRQVAGMGTPEVMPPEQWADASSVSAASDFYSLGCTFYYLLAGKMPFQASDLHGLMHAHLTQTPSDIRLVRKDVPARVANVIGRMMAKEASDRFATGRDLIAALAEGAVSSPTKKPQAPQSTRRVGIGIAFVALILGGSVAAFLLWPKGLSPNLYQEFITETQRKNADIWATRDALEGEISASPMGKVETPAALASLEGWLQERATERRDARDQFWTRIEELRKKSADVWPTSESAKIQLADAVAHATSPTEFKTIEDSFSRETTKRLAVHQKAKEYLSSVARENSDVWASDSELQAALGSSQSLSAIVQEDKLKSWKSAIDSVTAQKWAERLTQSLTETAKKNPDVWRSLELLEAFASKVAPIDQIRDASTYRKVLAEVESETWNRKATDWVVAYRKAHPLAWRSDTELMNVVAEEMKSTVASAESLDHVSAFVQKKTRETIRPSLEKWASEYATAHSEVWPDENPILHSLFPTMDAEPMAASDGKERFLRAADLLTIRKGMKFPPASDEEFSKEEQEAFQKDPDTKRESVLLRSVLDTYQLQVIEWLLSLHAQPTPPSVRVDVVIDINGEVVRKVPITTDENNPILANFTVRSSIDGFVTVFVFESTGKLMAAEFDQPIEAGKPTKCIQFDAIEPGVDKLLVYVTNVSPWRQIPPPPPSTNIKPGPSPFGPDFLQGLIRPSQRIEVAGRKRIASVLSSPNLLDDLLAHLRKGTPPPYVIANKDVKEWGRAEVDVEFVKETDTFKLK